MTLVVPIGFMMLMVAYRIWRNQANPFGALVKKSILLGLPIIAGLAAIAWYSWARFGSLTETGITYQLAGTNLQENLDKVFSPVYVIQNIYNYLLAPFRVEGQFPFLFSTGGRLTSIVPFIQLTDFYNTNLITGLVYVLPFLLFSVFHLVGRRRTRELIHDHPNLPFGWIMNTLAGSALIAFLFLLVFFWAAIRYVLDFSAMLLVVSIAGYFRGYLLAKEKGWEQSMAALGIFVAALSIFMSITLGISGNIVLIQDFNPGMLERLGRLGK